MVRNIFKFIFFGEIIFLTFIIKSGNTEIFTSVSDLENLIEIERLLISNLENYTKAITLKIDILKKKLIEKQKLHQIATANSFRYITNPINAFLIIKRLVRDWEEIKNDVIQDSENYVKNEIQIKEHSKFPTEEDVKGAAVGLIRLQDLYKLDTKLLALGIINAFQYSTKLSSSDCFEIGKWSPIQNDHRYAISWMTEAYEKLYEEGNQNRIDFKADVLDHLAYSLYIEGDVERALNLTNKILKLTPNHKNAAINKITYQDKIEQMKNSKDGTPIKNNYNSDLNSEHGRYEMLCRGDLGLTMAEQRSLRCRYLFGADPFLRIAPFKIEETHHDPNVVIFHDILTNNEIEFLKNMARPKLERSRVGNKIASVSESRISKVMVFSDRVHKIIDSISQRTQDMTNLSRISFEQTQVVNYGIGGFYYKHYDFLKGFQRNSTDPVYSMGDRIATVLYYLSDVEQGGATVFPRLKLSVRPKKGSALFWYNLHASGEPDIRTLHAGCPVLIGSKWIANKWIHEYDQEFRRLCNLKPDHPIENQL